MRERERAVTVQKVLHSEKKLMQNKHLQHDKDCHIGSRQLDQYIPGYETDMLEHEWKFLSSPCAFTLCLMSLQRKI